MPRVYSINVKPVLHPPFIREEIHKVALQGKFLQCKSTIALPSEVTVFHGFPLYSDQLLFMC